MNESKHILYVSVYKTREDNLIPIESLVTFNTEKETRF